MLNNDVGGRIREFRKLRGLNQDELAELASLNRVTIAKYESGKVEPGAKALGRIADALEITTDVLLGRKNIDPENTQNTAKTLEARIVSFGMDRLPQEEREKILSILQTMYNNNPALFKREGSNNDS